MSDTAGASSKVGSEHVEEFVQEHPRLVMFARIGWVSKGVVYALAGVLALTIAFAGEGAATPGGEASRTGAITRIGQASYGTAVLVIIVAGLVVYALWRMVSIVLPAKEGAQAWLSRVEYTASVVVYLLLARSAVSYIGKGEQGSSGEKSGEAQVDGASREVMSHTGGQWLVVLTGLVIVGAGVYFFIGGARRRFDDQLDGRGVGPLDHRHLVILGRVGWIGRGVMLALIGFFVMRAGWQDDADGASGLDGALRQASSSTIGTALVFVIAVGLIVYGVYCVISAPRRRLATADA